MGNDNLHSAKRGKNDEFYTRLEDVRAEIGAYYEHDPDVFRGKTVLLPCDDHESSAFTRFLSDCFDVYGIRKLVSTSYSPGGRGRLFTLEGDITGDGRANHRDTVVAELDGDGDFRSDEVRALRDEADIIITNPPFSLFREFLAWIVEAGKQFLIIGNMNAITYKETFPLIKNNQMWLGNGFDGGNAYFDAPDAPSFKEYQPDTGLVKFRNVVWFTDLDHGRRHEPLQLMTAADCLRYARGLKGRGLAEYERYDNYDAIEVPATKAIPKDYAGVMGVPITFLDKFCPEQFEIVGATESEGKGFSNGLWDASNGVAQATINGQRVYKRLFIRHTAASLAGELD